MTVRLWTNCKAATMAQGTARPYGLIDDAALAVDGEHIAWVGPRAGLPPALSSRVSESEDCQGSLITPGLIDCHTHLVYGGDRSHEFELRLGGASYEEVARAGGGIVSTVKATRAASEPELLAQSRVRLDALLAEG
ncbi:MAG TPA: imidazolonepropionase, partial [Ramlibacter sp.]|nr:imidazolonepropionase [Ramlibacter sp.]